jgi:pimeloyl-ACP methyl ester carboxylesterase
MMRLATSISSGRAGLMLLLVLTISTSSCLKATKPHLPRIFPPQVVARHTGKRPVIVIPGTLGSQLVNRRTGEQVWPGLFVPHSDTLALPIASTVFTENADDIVATEILETARLAKLIPEISVYDSLLETLERYGGYRRGQLDAPPEDGDRDTFYVFAYDWRRDNVESAQMLAQKIARLKQQLNRPDLRFDIIAHSMGGLVARYYAMYGDRDALQAGSDGPRPDWSGAQHLEKLVMLGTPNAGLMDALRTLLRGYSVVETNRPHIPLLNRLDREVVFTTPAVYQLLPHRGQARFLDAELQPLEVDLFDSETWRRFGWSVAFDRGFREREQRSLLKRRGEQGAAEANRRAAEREQFLRAALARAEAFHRALNAASAPPETLRFYLFGGDCEPTLDAAMIATIKGERRTLFSSGGAPGGRRARRRAFEAMFAPGDGRVTRRSLFGLRPNSATDDHTADTRRQTLHYATFSCELHGDLPLNLTLQDNLLTILLGNIH